jgi:large subunit ribosomal protein L15
VEAISRGGFEVVGLINARKGPAKLLATGDVTRAVTVRGIKMSASARQKIEAAGGRVEEKRAAARRLRSPTEG